MFFSECDMNRTKFGKVERFSVELCDDGAYIVLPHSESPYSPVGVMVTKNGVELDVINEEGQMLTKKIDYRDGLIMHRALTQIFGKKNHKKTNQKNIHKEIVLPLWTEIWKPIWETRKPLEEWLM